MAQSLESANAKTRASADQYAVVLQTLEADLAQDYINLRALEAQDDILTENIKLTQEQLDIIKLKPAGSRDSPAKLTSPRPRRCSTRCSPSRSTSAASAADAQHALAILVGKAPADFALTASPAPWPSPAIPPGLPADILRHRPDVVAAEQNLIAANAQVGVALTNYYPTVRLSGSAGTAASMCSMCWTGRAHWCRWVPASLPIFEGGSLEARLQSGPGPL